jgi:MscS family membrane protein
MLQLQFLNDLPPEVRNLALRIALALLALLIIWILRRLISRLILLPIRQLVVNRTTNQLDDILLKVIENPIRFLVIALGIYIAGTILTADVGTTLFFSHLARTFVILAVFVALYNGVDLIVQSSMRLRYITGISLDEQLVPFMRTALKVVIVAIAVIVVLQEWKYDVNGLIAGLGLSGLAFSLAAKDTAANLFAFTTIVSDRPFIVGEFIKTPDVEGIVEDVGMRNVRVRQLDQAYVTVPNSTIANAPILNWSRLNKRRVNFTLGVTYSASSDAMRQLLGRLRQMLGEREKIDPESIIVNFTDFGDSSLNILIVCMILEPDWKLFTEEKEQINLAIMDIVAELGLSIAFPSQSLYIEHLPDVGQIS